MVLKKKKDDRDQAGLEKRRFSADYKGERDTGEGEKADSAHCRGGGKERLAVGKMKQGSASSSQA